ncbi:MlaD family protein [Nocardia carnea]|uniref:MlaD family protein n=1 Tax=Nocardia carnea TaxID=37328 RepID=A0ABW7TST9_9NOCA|nr:MlaD family protein [Nocardia carnea]
MIPGRVTSFLAAAAVAVCTATGCSASLDELPLPAPGVPGDSWSVTATFANALNLPAKAKVRFNGADIGLVESMVARDYTAVVTMRIRPEVQLPAGTTAELRSATPMGDVYVALAAPPSPPPDGGLLRDGATIPIGSTSAAATIEEVLSRSSLLVNGGAIKNLTEIAQALGEHLDGRGDRVAAVLDRTRRLLETLTARSGQIDAILTSAAALSTTLGNQHTALGDAVAAAQPATQVLGAETDSIIALVDRVHAITVQLARFPSIQGTNQGSLVADINGLAAGLNAAALNPEADLGTLNDILSIVLKVTNGSSAHADIDVAQLALGAVPDPNFPGDPGARLPDATDWTAFVGSLQYMLGRLGGRLNGPPR